jgi:hypothetical protein
MDEAVFRISLAVIRPRRFVFRSFKGCPDVAIFPFDERKKKRFEGWMNEEDVR